MEELFASLSRRQTMMLLTAVTFGGQDALPVLGHLPDEESAVLRHRAEKMLEIPRERRIPLLVQEIKRLVTARKGHLWSAEPEALAGLLARERPALRELILRALPVALADAVRLHLPPAAVAVRDELPPGVLGIIRWKLEGLLQQASAGTLWKFSDLLMLKPRELYTLADRQGCRALATAIASLLGEEQAAFFQALPPELATLAQRAVTAAAGRELPQADARALLAQHGADGSPLEGIRSAGIQRIARACLAQGPDFAPRLLERHRPPFAPVFQRWMNDERTRAAAKGDGGRAEIVADLERLEARGLVEKPSRLPAMSRKPVVPPPAAQVRARPAAPVPPASAHRALPSDGMPVHERAPDRSRTPPVPPPAAARAEQAEAASWDAPPGAVDPRASRALRARPPAGAASVIAPLPQRPPPSEGAESDGWGEPPAPPVRRPSVPHSQGLPAHERGAVGESPAAAERDEGPAPVRSGMLRGPRRSVDGRPHVPGEAVRLQGRSTSAPEGPGPRPLPPPPVSARGAPVPRSRQGAPLRTGSPQDSARGDEAGRAEPLPPPVEEVPAAPAPQRTSVGTASVVNARTPAMRPPRSPPGTGDSRENEEKVERGARPLSAPIVGHRPGRTGVPPVVDAEDESTQAFRPPRRPLEREEARPGGAAAAAVPARAEDDERTTAFKPPRAASLSERAGRSSGTHGPAAELKTTALRPVLPGMPDEPPTASQAAVVERAGPGQRGAVRAGEDAEQRTVAFRAAGLPVVSQAGDDQDERTVAGRPGGAPGPGQRGAARTGEDGEARTVASRAGALPVPAHASERGDARGTGVQAAAGPVTGQHVDADGDAGADERTTVSQAPFAPRGARARPGGSDRAQEGRRFPPQAPPAKASLRPGPQQGQGRAGRGAPLGAEEPSTRTVGGDPDGDAPEPTEELSAPRLPRGGAGRAQGTAHLRGDGPPRGPVVTRPPQRRRSDSRIRKAVEPPIAPSPPSAAPPAPAPRSPRVVGSSTRHKPVKGPGRGPGGGTG